MPRLSAVGISGLASTTSTPFGFAQGKSLSTSALSTSQAGEDVNWSIRQFNRCAILIGAAPLPHQLDDPSRRAWVRRLGRLNALAGDDFNRGLRAYYFGLALLAWFVHPWAFAATTVWVVAVLYRREFASEPAALLSEGDESIG